VVNVSNKWIDRCDGSSTIDKNLQDFQQLNLGDLAITIFINGLDELIDFLVFNWSIAAKTLEGVVYEAKDLVTLEGSRFVSIIFVEDGINSLGQLLFRGFWHLLS